MGKIYNQLKEAEKARMNGDAASPAQAEKPVEKPAAQERPGPSRAPAVFFVAGIVIVLIANIAVLAVMNNVASEVRFAIDRTNSMEGDIDDVVAQVESIAASVEALKKDIELQKDVKPDEAVKNDIESLQISRDELRDRLNALEKAVDGLKSPPTGQQ